MKQLVAYWLGAILFVCALFGGIQHFRTPIQTENAEISSVKVFKAPKSPRSADSILNSTEFQASQYFGVNWQTGFTGLVGAVGCASCHSEKIYRVVKGDSLWRIAKKNGYADHTQLYRRNKKVVGSNPDLILIGQMLLIPAVPQSASSPSRASADGEKKLQTTKMFTSCVDCHGQTAQKAGMVDCRFCHKSPHVATAATLQAKRSVATRTAARSPSGVFLWKKPGGEPFGYDRDDELAIRMLSMPDNVANLFILAVRSTEPDQALIRYGEWFIQMLFGKYRVVDNVVASWRPSMAFWAKRWTLDYHGRRYELWRPIICGNWAWRSSLLPKPPTEIVITPLPPPPEVKAPTPAPLPPPPEVKAPTPAPLPPIAEPPIEPGCKFGHDWEGNAFAGIRKAVAGNAWHYYDGLNLAIFPVDCRRGSNHWRAGISGEVVAFEGHIDGKDYLAYSGNRQVYGGELQYFSPMTKTVFDLRYGRKKVEVDTKGGYVSRERVNILNADLVHSDWDTGIKSIKMLQYGVHTDWDLGGRKHSQVNGALLPASRDPRLDASEFSARVRAVGNEIGKTGLFPVAQLEGGYLAGPQIYAIEPRLGVELDDGWAELTGSYRANFQQGKSDDDTYGASFNLSLDKIWNRTKSLFVK